MERITLRVAFRLFFRVQVIPFCKNIRCVLYLRTVAGFLFSLLLLETRLMLIAEMFNNAMEALCDYVELKYDERIGIIKEVSAAAAGMSTFIWFGVMVLENYRGINSFFVKRVK